MRFWYKMMDIIVLGGAVLGPYNLGLRGSETPFKILKINKIHVF